MATIQSASETSATQTAIVRLGFVPSMRFPFSRQWCGEMRARTLKALGDVRGLEVVVPDESVTPYGLVQNDDQAAATLAFFREKGVDGVLIGAMDFADEISAATVAAGIGKPVFMFGTKEGAIRPDGERVSDSFCGTLSISTALHRRKIPFVFGGIVFPEEARFASEIKEFVSAVAAVKAFVGARVGQVGVRPERFETVAYDEVGLLHRFGQKIVPIELSEIVRSALAMAGDDPAIGARMEEMRAEATVVNVNTTFLEKAARFELALERFADTKGLSALAVQCWPALGPLLGIAACSTLGRLTCRGLMTACEVDVLGALDMVVQHNLALKETVPHFIDWTIQHRSRDDVFLAWHCGNGPTCLRSPGGEVTLRNRRRSLEAPIPENDSGAGVWEFGIRPGPVTLSRLVEYDGEYKMLVARGEIVEDEARERGTSAWVKVPNLERLYGTLVEEGFIHHASMVHGDHSAALGQFCKLLGIKPVVV